MSNSRLIERLKVIPAFPPIDTTGAGQDGDWVSLKHYRRCLTVLTQGAWAAGTSAVTFEQATDNAGTGAKTLAYTERYDGTILTDDTLAKSTVTSNTSNLANAANGVMYVEHHQQDLDHANGFAYLRVRTATPGANADLLAAHYVLGDPEHESKPETHLSAIA